MKQSLAILLLVLASPNHTLGDDALPCTNPRTVWTGAIRPGNIVFDVNTDRVGTVYLAGKFWGSVDFDPTLGLDERVAVGSNDACATKINADGSYGWTYSVGGEGDASSNGMASANADTVVVVGGFTETVDFDPTEAEDIHTSTYGSNAFITWLTANGDYIKTLSFGDPGTASVTRVAVDFEGNIILAGNCWGTTDLDPGPGVDFVQCVVDFFVMKLAPDGTRLWVHRIWGSGTRDHASDVDVDPEGNIYVTGQFEGIIDFDPGPEVDNQAAKSPYQDIFITKYASDGTYAWTRTYDARFPGGRGNFAVDDTGGCVITGGFRGTVDFDPSVEATDWRIAPDDVGHIFVTKLNTDGSYAWTYTIGNNISETGISLAVDAALNVYLLGEFWETMDFDPGPGLDEKTSRGADDLFVTKLAADGAYQYTRTWGSSANDSPPQGIVVDPTGGVVVVGRAFSRDDLDLDPGCEVLDGSEHSVSGWFNEIVKLGCPDLAADLDGDGDTDLLDFAAMQNCFTDVAPTACNPGCPRLDLDPDDDIDLTDFSYFLAELTGPQT